MRLLSKVLHLERIWQAVTLEAKACIRCGIIACVLVPVPTCVLHSLQAVDYSSRKQRWPKPKPVASLIYTCPVLILSPLNMWLVLRTAPIPGAVQVPITTSQLRNLFCEYSDHSHNQWLVLVSCMEVCFQAVILVFTCHGKVMLGSGIVDHNAFEGGLAQRVPINKAWAQVALTPFNL